MKKIFARIWIYGMASVLVVLAVFVLTMLVVSAFEGNWTGVITLAAFAAIGVTMWAIDEMD